MSHVASPPVSAPSFVIARQDMAVPHRIARMRGTVLCLFSTDRPLRSLEAALSRSGLTILRAQHDLHALILARATRPDLVIVDVPLPADSNRTILEQFRRQPNTASIPLLALVPTLTQQAAQRSMLRYASATMLQNASLEALLAEVRQLLTPADSWFHRVDPSAARIDAVFSEFGSRHYRKMAPPRRQPLPSGLTASSTHEQPVHKIDPAHSLPVSEHSRQSLDRAAAAAPCYVKPLGNVSGHGS